MLGGDLVSNDPFAYGNYLDFDPRNEIETQGTSLHIDYDFSNVTLASITAFRKLDQFQSGDVDYTSARLILPEAGDFRNTEIETFTQEIRLASNGDGPLQWIAGAFYFNEEVVQDETFGLGPDFRSYVDVLLDAGGAPGALKGVEAALGLPAGAIYATETGNQSEKYTLDDETLSLFVQFDYDLTDSLTLTAGVNHTQSEKDATANVVNDNLFGALPLDALGLGALGSVQFLPPVINYPNSVKDGKSDDSDTTYTVRLAYYLTSEVNVYAGVSTGFKATSWNLSQDSGPIPADVVRLLAATDPVLPNVGFGPGAANFAVGTRFADPEESLVYELGLKGQWNTVSLNMAIFMQEIEGFQSNVFSGTGFNLANAGKQSTDGVEVELTWLPVDGLRIGFAATWLDPLYDSFTRALGPDGPMDLSGEKPSGIPELSTNTNISYSFDLLGAYSYVRLEHVYEEDVQVVDNIPSSIAGREVNMVNASAGMSWSNGMEFNLWGRNIFDDEYLLSAFPSVAQSGSISGYPNQPATYGLTLKYNFGQ